MEEVGVEEERKGKEDLEGKEQTPPVDSQVCFLMIIFYEIDNLKKSIYLDLFLRLGFFLNLDFDLRADRNCLTFLFKYFFYN